MSALSGKKTLFALLVCLFLVASIGGAFALCGMNPLEHLSHWQSISAATTQDLSSTALLLLMTVVAFLYFLHGAVPVRPVGVYVPRYRGGGREFDPLRLAFARGILHTKAY